MESARCYQCGTDEPVGDKHWGWLDLTYADAPWWRRRFCGSLCLQQWLTESLAALGLGAG